MPSRGSLVYSGRHALPLCPEPVKMSRNPEKRYWYEVVAEMLAAEGVSDCFALLGDANMHMATHLDSLGTRMIHVRHEHCAVAAAMGYARKTGRTGVATVTCGPGLTQLMTALPAAVRAHIPLVVIAGEAPLTRAWYNQGIAQAPFVEATGAAYRPLHHPPRFATGIRDAFLQARTEMRPVVVGIPFDLAESEAVDAPVLMTSEGFSPLFSMVVPPAMTGEKMVRKESFWSDRLGQQVINPALSIHDNGVLEGGMSSGSRDAEGVPRQRQVLVENGRLATMLWSTRDAAQQVAEGRVDAAASTGSATSGSHQSPPSTGCTELFLTSAEAPRTTDELLAHMGDGYVVNSVMGAHTANPSSGDFSVTTSSILKVEGGEIVGALKQAGLSGNLAKALNGAVVLGDDVRRQGSYSSGSMHLPDVLLMDGLRVNPA